MATRANIASKHGLPETDNIYGMDVYSADGELIGRSAGYLDQVPDDEVAFERGPVDPINAAGEPIGPRHVLINGHGYSTQAQIVVPVDQLEIDARGRRITLRLTLDQIRAMPHYTVNTEQLMPTEAAASPGAPEAATFPAAPGQAEEQTIDPTRTRGAQPGIPTS
ncbi:MAG TPA: PRC-barrel domain-containing protein [Chthonomonadaceae bacterium]|nr:PRC-barrel domain-containing protein [Chthonomonadaceae bacterium]